MSTVGTRIRAARARLAATTGGKVTQAELSVLCGWADTNTRIANYENDVRTPSSKDLEKIASAIKCRVEWLQFGSGPIDPFGSVVVQEAAAGYSAQNAYPLLASPEIGPWLTGSKSQQDYPAHISSLRKLGDRTFVFSPSDDAMSPTLSIGGKVFIDPDWEVPHGAEVKARMIALVKVGEHYALRIETQDLGKCIYEPLATGFRTLSQDECEVIGYAVGIPEENWELHPERKEKEEGDLLKNDN